MDGQNTNGSAGKTQKISGEFLHGDRTEVVCRVVSPSSFIAADSHPGFIRKINEDSFVYCAGRTSCSPSLLAVADGIGGHGNGEYASCLLIRLLVQFWREYSTRLPEDRDQLSFDMDQAVRMFNKQIYGINCAVASPIPMGTTLALLLLMPGKYAMTLHLGDSRVYRLRQEKLEQLTADHSYIAEMLRKGTITPEQAERHPMAHVILRSVGALPDTTPEIHFHDWQFGDRYLVCSDGLTTHLSNERICHILQKAPAASDATHSLLLATLREGARDNVTILNAFF